MLVALVDLGAGDAIEEARHLRNGIVGLLGIGGVALLALGNDREAHRAAAADLQGVAELVGAAWLAYDAVIGYLALLLHPGERLGGAVDGRTFLIAGDQKGNGARQLAAIRYE